MDHQWMIVDIYIYISRSAVIKRGVSIVTLDYRRERTWSSSITYIYIYMYWYIYTYIHFFGGMIQLAEYFWYDLGLYWYLLRTSSVCIRGDPNVAYGETLFSVHPDVWSLNSQILLLLVDRGKCIWISWRSITYVFHDSYYNHYKPLIFHDLGKINDLLLHVHVWSAEIPIFAPVICTLCAWTDGSFNQHMLVVSSSQTSIFSGRILHIRSDSIFNSKKIKTYHLNIFEYVNQNTIKCHSNPFESH